MKRMYFMPEFMGVPLGGQGAERKREDGTVVRLGFRRK